MTSIVTNKNDNILSMYLLGTAWVEIAHLHEGLLCRVCISICFAGPHFTSVVTIAPCWKKTLEGKVYTAEHTTYQKQIDLGMLLRRVKWRALTKEPAIQICRSRLQLIPHLYFFGIVSSRLWI